MQLQNFVVRYQRTALKQYFEMKKRRVITALFFMYIIVFRTYDAILSLSLNLSLIMAMNSELVGLPRSLWTVYPKYELSTSTSPRSHATSMAWRMARSTLDEVVEYFFATAG